MHQEVENNLIYLLRQIKEVLDEHDIEFWLDCGTLLGAVRDGKFIPWEHDIDLGVWQHNISNTMKNVISSELYNRGFRVNIFKTYIHIHMKGKIYHADINIYRLDNNNAIIPRFGPISLKDRGLYYFAMLLSNPYDPKFNPRRTNNFIKKLIKSLLYITIIIFPLWLRKYIARIAILTYKKKGEKNVSWELPSRFFMDLSTIRFYEMELKIPNKTKEYLTYRYGKDWQIPRKNWRTNINDGVVIDHQSKY